MVKVGRVVKQPTTVITKQKRPNQPIKPTLIKRSAPRKVTAPPPTKTRPQPEEVDEEEEVEVMMDQGEVLEEVEEEVTEDDVNFIDDSEALEVDTEYATGTQQRDDDDEDGDDYDQSQENNYSDDEEYDEVIEDDVEQPPEEDEDEAADEEEKRMTRRIQPRREVNKTDRQIPPSIAITAEVADFSSSPSSPPKDEIDLSGGDKDGDGEGFFKTIDEKIITPVYNLGEGSMSYITKSRWGKVKEGKGNKRGIIEVSNEKEYLNGCIKKKYIAKGTKKEKEMVNWMKIKTYFKLGKSIEMQRKYLAKHLDIHYDADGNVY